MKTIDYNFYGRNKKLCFWISNYVENDNLYLWLFLNNWEPFCDISCNYWILWENEISLDHDFVDMCWDLLDRLVNEWILEDKNIYYKVNLDKVKEYKCLQF